MSSEINNFIKVWITALASQIYCYLIIKKISPKKTLIRLLIILPVIFLFTLLPLSLSSPHLIGITSFFFTWLGNFKLILFSFNHGPLSSSLSLLQFIFLASFPIKIKSFHRPQAFKSNAIISLKSPAIYTIKFLLFAIIIRLHDYRSYLDQNVILALLCCHLYLAAEILLLVAAVLGRSLLRIEMEPHFDEPYLATSLQDFWGRRWNLMVTSILRPTVYDPVRSATVPAVGKRWGSALGLIAAFVVSGLMHELIWFYLTRVEPTWEVTLFFALQGVCTVLEVMVKNAVRGKWEMNRMVSRVLTIGFVMGSSFWLFFPQLVRTGVDLRTIREYGIVCNFVRDQVLKPLRLL